MRYADFVSFTYISLRAQRLRTALTALGIAVGIAAVILLTSIGEGLHGLIVDEFTQFGTNIIAINPGRIQTHGAALGAAEIDMTIFFRSLARVPLDATRDAFRRAAGTDA